MLRRFAIGLMKGLLVGGLVLSALLFGLKLVAVPLWAAYLLSVGVGAVTGLVAGKPIWQNDATEKGVNTARIEAGLKAVAGMLLAALGMFALSRWGTMLLNPALLHQLLPAKAGAAQVPAGTGLLFLPAITTVLGLLFELDNTPAPEGDKAEKPAAQLSPGPPRARVSSEIPSSEELDDAADESRQAQRRNKR